MGVIIKYYYDEHCQKYPIKTETEDSAGIDLRSQDVYTVRPNQRVLVNTGLHVEIPKGYEIQIRPRSGLALKKGITILNTPGTVDSDFRGKIGVILFNTSEHPFVVNVGDRIAQMVVARVYTSSTSFKEVDSFEELSETERGESGFGSTGQK